ncbi:MAG: hypothetical protein ACK5R5_05755 [Alphaproteobacteria bacterium]
MHTKSFSFIRGIKNSGAGSDEITRKRWFNGNFLVALKMDKSASAPPADSAAEKQ